MVSLFLTCDYRLGVYKLARHPREKELGRKSQLQFKASLPFQGLSCFSSSDVPCSVVSLGQGMDVKHVGAILAVESHSQEASSLVPCVSNVIKMTSLLSAKVLQRSDTFPSEVAWDRTKQANKDNGKSLVLGVLLDFPAFVLGNWGSNEATAQVLLDRGPPPASPH